MAQQSSGFWTSLPGVITALGTLITAITGLYIAVQQYGPDDAGRDTKTEKPAVVVEQPQRQPESQPQSLSQSSSQPSPQPRPGAIVNSGTAAIQSQLSPKIIAKKLPQTTLNQTAISQLQARSLVDCQHFPTVNTVKSLMSWSNYYHQKIVDANGERNRSSMDACKKTISYRAQAHCKVSADVGVRQSLFETLSLCNGMNISWKEAIPQ